MKWLVALSVGLLLLIPSFSALTDIRRNTPAPERLGYIPSFEVAFFSSLEYRLLISELLFYDAIFYYGTMMERPKERPEFERIFKYVNTSTRLNPYNIDSYYFGQAILTSEAGMVREMNALLLRGLPKRNWDFYLPFFLGFNYSYYLHEYGNAAKYMARAAELNPAEGYLASLTGRLYYQANKTDLAIQYLKTMAKGVKNAAVKKSLEVRIDAFERIAFLENAVKLYESRTGKYPAELNDLVRGRVLKGIPPDPYGGEFYIDPTDRSIKTTSNFAAPRSNQ
jgi:hypothetical protein